MTIHEHTPIAALIKADKRSIDAIASLAKPLEKLRNPILRKLMASRVTIHEAAQMAGCTLSDFQRVLTPLGFQFAAQAAPANDAPGTSRPAWLNSLSAAHTIPFDVRELLAEGKDPLKEIMAEFKKVPSGSALCLITTFIPVPLIRLLEKDQVVTFTEEPHPKEFHTYFYKRGNPSRTETMPGRTMPARISYQEPAQFEQALTRFEASALKRIDVRELPMPEPMQRILKELDELSHHTALFVRHKRVPVYLLEELADKQYQVFVCSYEENDVRLLLFKLE